MKVEHVTSSNNNYLNFKFKSEGGATMLRAVLRRLRFKVDLYQEAKRTVRLYL